MSRPRTTRRRWLAVAAVAGLATAGSPELRAQSEWIGEAPPAEYHSPERQFFLRVDLDGAVDDTLRDLLAELQQALADAEVQVTWAELEPPEYRFKVEDPLEADRALQIIEAAVPDAEIEVAGAEIRIRFVDSLLDRIRREIVLKSANLLRFHARRVLTGPVADDDGQDTEIKVYVHESNCLRLDLVGRIEPHHAEPLNPYIELVPLYPTLDADSDHLPQGYSSLRIERDRGATMPVEHKATRPADERLPEFRPEEPPLEALKRWKSTPMAEPQDRQRETQDRWRNIVGGRPMVTNGHFVNAEMIPLPQAPVVSLRLDVVGEARAARLLPGYAGRQFGLVVDNIVIGRFSVAKVDRGIALWPKKLTVEAEELPGLLNDSIIAADLESVDACPAKYHSR